MKSVLISIQPKWIEKICTKIGEENGKPIYKKRIEVRKSKPSLATPFKCYIYCTNRPFDITDIQDLNVESVKKTAFGRGKVIGEFVCDKVYDLIQAGAGIMFSDFETLDLLEPQMFRDMSCLTDNQLTDYLDNKDGYAWHITDLKIYDKPKELSEFYSAKWDMPCEHKKRGFNMDFCMAYENGSHFCKELICDKKRLTRPPQSWQFIEVGD